MYTHEPRMPHTCIHALHTTYPHTPRLHTPCTWIHTVFTPHIHHTRIHTHARHAHTCVYAPCTPCTHTICICIPWTLHTPMPHRCIYIAYVPHTGYPATYTPVCTLTVMHTQSRQCDYNSPRVASSDLAQPEVIASLEGLEKLNFSFLWLF